MSSTERMTVSQQSDELPTQSAPLATPDQPGGSTGAAGPAAGRATAGWDVALAVGALALALVGQFYFSNIQQNIWDGATFFLAAMAVFLILVSRSEGWLARGVAALRESLQRLLDAMRAKPMRVTLLAIAAALAYTDVRLLGIKPGTESYLDVLILWLLACISYAAAFVEVMRPNLADLRGRLAAWARLHRWDLGIVAGLTLLAGVARFWALGSIPNVISGDEGVVGQLAMRVVRGQLHNMMATVTGQSTMYIFLIAGAVKWLGANPLGLRLVAAIGGTLTVPMLYLFARRMFSMRVAFLAVALMAASHFHVHFSRIIIASSLHDALFALAGFYLLLTGLQARSIMRLVAAGLVIGLELYIYMGARLVILLVPFYIAALAVVDRNLVRQNVGNLLAFAGAWAVIAAPMMFWAVKNPGEFMARINQLGIYQSGWLAAEAAKTGQSEYRILLDQLWQAFLTVNFYPAKAFYYSNLPMLDFVSGALFVLGLLYSLAHARDPRHLLLQGWFWAGVVGAGALVVVPATSAYRIMIVFPVVCLFVALAADQLLEQGLRIVPAKRQVAGVLTLGVAALIAGLNLRAYFVDYAGTCQYEDVNTRFASHLGQHLRALDPSYTPYLVAAPRIRYGIHQSVDFLSGGIPVTEIVDPLTEPPTFINRHSPAAFFFTPERVEDLSLVDSYLPGGREDRLYDCGQLMMIVYVAPGP